jgi:hypothetical protein
MDVREKLVELKKVLRECLHFNYDEFSCDMSLDVDLTAENLIAHGVTVQEWISTDERMPTEDDATDGYVAVVYAWGDGVKTKTISLIDVVVAHPDLYDYWMPLNLPQPPKGE